MATVPRTPDVLAFLAESYLGRIRQGEDPSIEEYATQHPELGSEIRELLGTLRVVEGLGERSQFGGSQGVPRTTIPARLGDFQLTFEIARGGMGIVFEALQIQLGRRVAVKVLPPSEVADISRRLRFQREARAAANLHHTNIVPVFDVGEQDGICYYAMQFIEGETLAEVWRELRRMRSVEPVAGSTDVPAPDRTLTHSICQKLFICRDAIDPAVGQAGDSAPRPPMVPPSEQPPDGHTPMPRPGPRTEQLSATSRQDPRSSATHWKLRSTASKRQFFDNVTRIVWQIVDALTYAHSNGVLHRDIKPSNVILDTHCRAWLTDFGLAKVGGDDLTAENHLVGTLRYMSPERFSGQVDERSDVYSAGLMLYEFITLRPAFDALDHAGMMHLIQHVRPISPRACDPSVPRDLETIVLCAIDKDPAKRYQTAAAMASDLRRYLEGRSLSARRASHWEHAWRWCRRNPVVATLAVALAGVILTAWLTTFLLWRRAEASHAEAQTNVATANRNLDLAVAAVNQFCAKVSDDLRLKEQDLRPLRKELLTTAVGFHQQLLELRAKSDLARIDLARSYHNLAQLTAEIEAFDRAKSLFLQANAEFEAYLKDQPDDAATQYELCVSLGQLARLLVEIGESPEAERHFERAIRTLTSLLESQPDRSSVRAQLAELLSSRAYTRSMTQRFDEAIPEYLQAIKYYEFLRSRHTNEVTYTSNLAHTRLKLADALIAQSLTHWQDADAELRTALELQRGATGHPRATDFEWRVLGSILRSIGRVEKVSGRNQEGIQHLQESIDVFEGLMQRQPSVFSHASEAAMSYAELGYCYDQADDMHASEAAFRQAAVIWEGLVTRAPGSALWESHYAKTLSKLGDLARRQGNLAASLADHSQAVTLLDEILQREPGSLNAHRFLGITLCDRGKVLCDLQRYREAVADFDRALEVDRNASHDSVRLARSYAVVRSGDHAHAVRDARASLTAMAEECDPRFLSPSFLLGAKICGRATALAKVDASLSEADCARLQAEYATQAIDMLRQSIAAGLEFSADVQQSPDFEALRDHPEFAALARPAGQPSP